MAPLGRRVSLLLLAAAGLFVFPGRGADPVEPDPKIISYTLPENIEWMKGENADVAFVQGDPDKPGIYIQIIKWHPHNMSRPHFHATDRYITVLSGTWWMGQGPKYDPDSTFPVPAGTYVVHHKGEIHYDGAKDEECMLYIVGMGPLTTTPAESQ